MESWIGFKKNKYSLKDMSLYRNNILKIYNSLSGEKEIFTPVHEGNVGMYVCGPTVYSNVHLGNVRTFMSFDVIFRYLLHLGYKTRYVRNITDVGHIVDDVDDGEDKIAKKARLEQLEPMEIVQRYTVDFHTILDKFNFLPPSIEPTATGHIIEQIEIVKEIIENGYGYEANGSVYFDVVKFNETHNYGRLSGRNIEDMLANTRDTDGQRIICSASAFFQRAKSCEFFLSLCPSVSLVLASISSIFLPLNRP